MVFFGSSIVVVHDELTLPLGVLKISNTKGAGGHNGVKSIMAALSTPLIRVRIGIGSKTLPDQSLSDYVLSKFSQMESDYLGKRLPILLVQSTLLLIQVWEKTMNIFNQEKQIETTL